MKNYMAIVQYDGSKYSGWQRQDKNDKTIQHKIEQVISKMVGKLISINGSGRTDASVHALGQVINFKIMTEMSEEEIKTYLNEYLPMDIRIMSVKRVEDRFHARLSAKSKRYTYHIINNENMNIFRRQYTYHLVKKLDIKAMNEAIPYLEGTHDFAAFTSKKNSKKSSIRTIKNINITEKDGEIEIEFVGDGFLYHMVRILVGTLIEVGYHEKSPIEIMSIIESKERAKAGYLVPGHGLFLDEVNY